MKKFLYILLFAFAIATTFTSCTDENIAPKANDPRVGGASQDPKG